MNQKKKASDYQIVPDPDRPEHRMVNIRGRAEHEEVLRDAELCKELGLDQYYETMVYLKRWGSWLSE